MRSAYFCGQSISEYVLVLAIIFAAILSTQTLTKRGIQGVIKTTANELSKGIEPWRGGAWEGQGIVRLEYLDPTPNGLVVSTNPKSTTLREFPPSGSNPVRTVTLNNDDVTNVTGHWKASYQYHPGEGIKEFKESSR